MLDFEFESHSVWCIFGCSDDDHQRTLFPFLILNPKDFVIRCANHIVIKTEAARQNDVCMIGQLVCNINP